MMDTKELHVLNKGSLALVTAVVLAAGGTAALGQCVQGWTAVGNAADSGLAIGVATGGAVVQAMTTWDPDGAGPLAPRIVATGTGSLLNGGTTAITRIGMWDGTAWQAFGGGGGISDGRSLAVRANGDLVVVGAFTSADGTPANRVASFTPGASTFAPFGGGLNSIALTANLYQGAGGEEVIAGGFLVGKVASWDGSNWNQMNGGVGSTVTCSAILANGDLVIGGGFTTVNGGADSALQVARWNGSTWSPLAEGIATGTIRCMLPLPNGHLIVGGGFTSAGPVTNFCNFIAEWDGSAWHAMGLGMTGTGSNPGVYGLARLPNGDIVAGGNFDTAGGVVAHKVARWDGSSWSPMGASGMNGTVFCFTQLNGELYAGGDFSTADGNTASRFAKFGNSTQAVADVGIQGGLPGHDGLLNNNDFIAFINYFFLNDPIADMGVQGGEFGSDGQFDNNDFVAFINAFFTGCS